MERLLVNSCRKNQCKRYKMLQLYCFGEPNFSMGVLNWKRPFGSKIKSFCSNWQYYIVVLLRPTCVARQQISPCDQPKYMCHSFSNSSSSVIRRVPSWYHYQHILCFALNLNLNQCRQFIESIHLDKVAQIDQNRNA